MVKRLPPEMSVISTLKAFPISCSEVWMLETHVGYRLVFMIESVFRNKQVEHQLT